MPSLYETLGVPEDATEDQIKEAYRKLAKKLHPDAPDGDAEAFKSLSHAVAILSDPDKRSQYDRTGSENTASPEERENAMALELLSKMFSHLFTMAEFDPATHDPLIATKKLIKMDRAKAQEAENKITLVLNRMRKTIKRLKRKGKDMKASKLACVLDALEKSTMHELEGATRAQRVCNKALLILKEHDYELDKKPAAPVFSAGGFFKGDPVMQAAMEKAMDNFKTKKQA